MTKEEIILKCYQKDFGKFPDDTKAFMDTYTDCISAAMEEYCNQSSGQETDKLTACQEENKRMRDTIVSLITQLDKSEYQNPGEYSDSDLKAAAKRLGDKAQSAFETLPKT